MLSEGGMRVPFVVYWKNRIAAAQVYDHPVISLDVAATAVSLAGLPADPQLDGVNLIPCLTGENSNAPHKTLYWHWIAQAATRAGKWKYLRGGAREYLYDRDNDREEKHDVIRDHPQVVARLRKQLNVWAAELQPPGLTTGNMSDTWKKYFDHYLDKN
jgi:arylsulfatase A-like enzyme